jgi:hypothetical protein
MTSATCQRMFENVPNLHIVFFVDDMVSSVVLVLSLRCAGVAAVAGAAAACVSGSVVLS